MGVPSWARRPRDPHWEPTHIWRTIDLPLMHLYLNYIEYITMYGDGGVAIMKALEPCAEKTLQSDEEEGEEEGEKRSSIWQIETYI